MLKPLLILILVLIVLFAIGTVLRLDRAKQKQVRRKAFFKSQSKRR